MARKRSIQNISNRFGTLMSLVVILLFQTFINLYIVPCAQSQTMYFSIDIPSSFNPVGSGARALGMGGAFIAVADDATSASWNPGGLIQLEKPEMSIVGAGFSRIEDLEFGVDPSASGPQTVDKYSLNYMSGAYPFTAFGRNMIVSANYQNLYDLTREWGFPLSISGVGQTVNQYVDYDNQGTLAAYGLAYAIQIMPTLSLGFTLNYWGDGINKNGWEQNIECKGSGDYLGTDFVFQYRTIDDYSFKGFNMNFGFLWNVTSSLNVGAVFKTPFTADIKHTSIKSSTIQFSGTTESTEYYEYTADEELEMPMSYGIGVAYRFSDEFTMSLDMYRTEWDDFEYTDYKGNKKSPISGLSSSESNIDPTTQVRMGAEYLFINPKYVIPLRAGLFYDPAPAEGSPDDYYGFAVGTGITVKRFIFDIAYQYRFGNDVGSSILQNLEFSEDIEEHTFYASIILHF